MVVVRRAVGVEVVAMRRARWARARENIVVGLFCWRELGLCDGAVDLADNWNLKDDLG
jgi:hypothetical protein